MRTLRGIFGCWLFAAHEDFEAITWSRAPSTIRVSPVRMTSWAEGSGVKPTL